MKSNHGNGVLSRKLAWRHAAVEIFRNISGRIPITMKSWHGNVSRITGLLEAALMLSFLSVRACCWTKGQLASDFIEFVKPFPKLPASGGFHDDCDWLQISWENLRIMLSFNMLSVILGLKLDDNFDKYHMALKFQSCRHTRKTQANHKISTLYYGGSGIKWAHIIRKYNVKEH